MSFLDVDYRLLAIESTALLKPSQYFQNHNNPQRYADHDQEAQCFKANVGPNRNCDRRVIAEYRFGSFQSVAFFQPRFLRKVVVVDLLDSL